MIDHKIRNEVKDQFLQLDKTNDQTKIYELLEASEQKGFTWGERKMYGGGINIVVYDEHDTVIDITFYNDEILVSVNQNYFHEKYVATEVIYLNNEQLAEIRNEEALYGYELPHYRVHHGYIAE